MPGTRGSRNFWRTWEPARSDRSNWRSRSIRCPRCNHLRRRRSSTRRSRASASDAVLVVGVDKLLTAPARCCKPVPPDPIVGFVTRGRGVTVHRANCLNLKRLDARRRVAAEWGQAAGVTFPVEVEIEAIDRTGLLRDISEVLSRERINVTATHSLSSQLAARMRFTLEVFDAAQLKHVLGLIREVRGVISAVRR